MIIRYYDKRHLEIGALDEDGCLWFAQSGKASRLYKPTDERVYLENQDHELHIYNIAGHDHRSHERDSKAWEATCEGLSSIYKAAIPHKSYHA